MEETLGAQYAIQVAINTLRDRCMNLQRRVNELECENVDLRVRCDRAQEHTDSLSETDRLRAQVTELIEQKQQLTGKIKLVTGENQDLWRTLGKLTRANKTLGNQLSKISDTLAKAPPAHTTLIRSKTFTQDEPHLKFPMKNLEENGRISLELEDISLKLTDSFSRQKKELDQLVSEIQCIQFDEDVVTEEYGFAYEEDTADNDELRHLFAELKSLRENALQQQNILAQNVRNMEEALKNKKKVLTDHETSTEDLIVTQTAEVSTETMEDIKIVSSSSREDVKICPLCTKTFAKDIDFVIFQQHVEDHFIGETYEML